jgi:HD-GYP domain-containing protein (c-di-GMP phosphodiesterase class II)
MVSQYGRTQSHREACGCCVVSPDGYQLAGTSIPIGSRIVAVCDAWHAMTSDRPYRRALTRQRALAELSTGAGAQFDPDVVHAPIASVTGRENEAIRVGPQAAAAHCR